MKVHLVTAATVGFGIVGLGIVTPVMAQEVASPESRATHFDGLYVGGSFGGQFNAQPRNSRLVFDTNRDGSFGDTVRTAGGADAFSPGFCNGRPLSNSADTSCDRNSDDISYAAHVGFDKRFDHLVVGGLFEASRSNARQNTTGFSSTPARYTISRRLDYALAVRGRAGYTPNGGILFYGTGGVGYAKIQHDFSTSNALNSFTEFRDGKRRFGYQYGGGAEIMLTNHISIGLEYLFNNYKDNRYFVGVGPGAAPATNPFLIASAGGTNLTVSNDRYKFHTMQGTVNFRF